MEPDLSERYSAGFFLCGISSLLLIVIFFSFANNKFADDPDPLVNDTILCKADEVIKNITKPDNRVITSKKEDIYNKIIYEASKQYCVDTALIKAIIMAESSYDHSAISNRGAIGLMQLMPDTADELGVEDIFDPVHNIKGGTKYIKQLLERFDGNIELALAAYNAGSTKVKRYNGIPPFETTRIYIKKVFEYYLHYQLENQA